MRDAVVLASKAITTTIAIQEQDKTYTASPELLIDDRHPALGLGLTGSHGPVGTGLGTRYRSGLPTAKQLPGPAMMLCESTLPPQCKVQHARLSAISRCMGGSQTAREAR